MIIPFGKLQGAAGIFALLALLTSFVALLTPAWQVVYAREIQQWIQSGLWLNCQTRPAGMYTCTYTFSESDFDFYTSAELINLRTPPFFAWQRTLLAVFLTGQLFVFLAFVSLTLSFVATTRLLSAILQIVTLSVATLLHAGGLIAFAMFSQMVEYRFYHVSVSGIYEKQRGSSFYAEMAAAGILIVALIFAVAHLIIDYAATEKTKNNNKNYYQQQQHEQLFEEEPYSFQQRTNNNSNNNSTNNIFPSNYSEASFGASPYAAKAYGYRQTPPDLSSPYLPYAASSEAGRSDCFATSFEESAFAMRELPKPPLPPPYR